MQKLETHDELPDEENGFEGYDNYSVSDKCYNEEDLFREVGYCNKYYKECQQSQDIQPLYNQYSFEENPAAYDSFEQNEGSFDTCDKDQLNCLVNNSNMTKVSGYQTFHKRSSVNPIDSKELGELQNTGGYLHVVATTNEVQLLGERKCSIGSMSERKLSVTSSVGRGTKLVSPQTASVTVVQSLHSTEPSQLNFYTGNREMSAVQEESGYLLCWRLAVS